ncbi:SIR2 family protein [Paraburkholderia sp. SIMBA_055]
MKINKYRESGGKMKSAFEYLVASIQGRRCIPLIGAGISLPSKWRGGEWRGHFVGSMIDKVIAPTFSLRLGRLSGEKTGALLSLCIPCHVELSEFYERRMSLTSQRCPFCDLREAKAGQLLTKACEAYLWEHGGPRDETYAKLVKTLEIEGFNELEPTSAHFFLAFLAREGLITEFVTTNYDCNLENAYRFTWGAEAPDVYSICDLNSFALNAAHSSTWVPGQETPHALKVFKINGCAARLKDSPPHAKDILLTSSQLQDWRARRWAADFFRTKVRMACMVTIGFGSDEPQVVHTLQQIAEEFSDGNSGVSGASTLSVFDAPNAPIVTLYEPYPTFPQLQLVYGFSSWLTGNPYGGDALVLGPIQRAGVKPPQEDDGAVVEPDGLTADRLWGDVFQQVFAGLLVRQLRAAALAGNAAFTAAIPHANALLTAIAEELHSDFLLRMQPSAGLGHWLAKLVDSVEKTAAQPPELTRCITHLLGKAGHPARYVAVSDYGSLFCELVVVLALLLETRLDSNAGLEAPTAALLSDVWGRVQFHAPGVLEIVLSTDDSESGVAVDTSIFVSTDASTVYLESSGANLTGAAPKRLEIVLGLGGRTLMDLDRRSFSLATKGTAVSLIRLDWKAIFPPEYPVRSYMDLSRRLRDAVAFPTKYRRRQDRSIRTNRFLERSAHD